ncbi:TPA: anthranilate phosphoribosyltransferase [Candidatus Micrarchaeota archaeon]|nr:anthranilate phosphoribosyltransferase [Candidatus Micrarchaeota archaeon]
MKILRKLTEGQDLSSGEAEALMEGMMAGDYTPAQTASLLVALRMKGESDEEIAAFASVMRKHAVRISPKAERLVDTCGTGGDSSHTFNISTCAGLIASGAGVSIAKHGNRSVSSKSGSADVLEALGCRLLEPDLVEKCIGKVGFGFMFAPYFHPAMKNVAPIRRELGIRTVFNILGPLTNPAGAHAQLLGVFDAGFAAKMARALARLSSTHALVVHSEGLDEIGLGKTEVHEVRKGEVTRYVLDASRLGFQISEVPKAHSAQESAEIITGVLEGKKGAARDISLLNAAAAIYVGGKADSLERGMELARDSVDSGKAREKLEALKAFPG